ncbi:MAG: hypothetical protein IH600_18000 [Bacteroidetes bacterium]|nr:hypothetical protein [Bacteroidota bacterium]
MFYSFYRSILLMLMACGMVFSAAAQQHRTLIISSEVGPVIDETERQAYDLFRDVEDFRSASFSVDAKDSLWLHITRATPDGNSAESITSIPYTELRLLAERVSHWEKLKDGVYVMGSEEPVILYEDGTPLPVSAKTATESQQQWYRKHARYVENDAPLPLAANTTGLQRPRFAVLRLGLSVGMMNPGISEVEGLMQEKRGVVPLVGVDLDIPLYEQPEFRLMLGWQGAFISHSFLAVASYRPGSIGIIRPVLGFGAGHCIWNFENDHLKLRTGYTYPLAQLGISIDGRILDLVFTVPLTGVKTTFDGKDYRIAPAGPNLALRIAID